MIKQQLRKVAKTMAAWPLVGRFVRIGVAVIRLPEFRAAYLDLNHRQLASDNDKENLVKSVPVALRKITRDLIEIRGQLETVSSSMDQRLNDTRGQLETVSSSVDYLLGRVEFVRRELMFEMRYGAKAPNSDIEQIKTKGEIVNPEKLAAARNERLRLNLGCGHIALEGYLNVDRRALPGVDIVAEVDELPFEPGEVDEIFSAHLLEHFPQEQLLRELLPYWIGLLKHGGVLRSVVPDAESMIKGYANGSYPYSSLREVTFGAQDYDGDFHFNMFVAEQIEEILKEAGLMDIEWLAKGRKNGACFEMEFKAVKK
jgi:SAM-dependent methyltransferase